MITTRIGLNSKMIICGDDAQIDLKNKKESGFKFLYTISKKIKNMEAISLFTNHRDPIVDDLIEMYYEFYQKTQTKSNSGHTKN
jgi:phosphate starvation-inducible PhoH-like protein